MSLSAKFDEAHKIYDSIDQTTLESANPALQKQIAECVNTLHEIQQEVVIQGLFSGNEEKDDIKTGCIKFLLVPYYLGDLLQKIIDTNHLMHLQRAKGCLEIDFLKKCLRVGILKESEYEQLLQHNPVVDRQSRIANLKKEKEIAATLAELSQRKKKLNKAKVEEDDDAEGEYEEVEREYRFLSVDLAIRKCSGQLRALNTEIQLLSMSQAQKDSAVEEYKQRQAEAKEDPPSNLVIPAGGAPATLREQLASEVFKPVNQPTMTPEQWFEMNKEDIVVQQQQPKWKTKTKHEPEDDDADRSEDEHDDEDDDEKLQKQRATDDFKDTHPAGWGNRKGNTG